MSVGSLDAVQHAPPIAHVAYPFSIQRKASDMRLRVMKRRKGRMRGGYGEWELFEKHVFSFVSTGVR